MINKVKVNFSQSGGFIDHDIGYRLTHHDDLGDGPQVEVQTLADGAVFEEDGVRIIAAATDHSPVHPTLGYRVEYDGKAAAIAGDTVPCDGLDRICANADIYVQTAIRSDLIEQSPSARLRDVLDYHSDIGQAGTTAARCGVKTLVLNHLVPPPPPGKEGPELVEVLIFLLILEISFTQRCRSRWGRRTGSACGRDR